MTAMTAAELADEARIIRAASALLTQNLASHTPYAHLIEDVVWRLKDAAEYADRLSDFEVRRAEHESLVTMAELNAPAMTDTALRDWEIGHADPGVRDIARAELERRGV